MKNMTLEKIALSCHGRLVLPEGWEQIEGADAEASGIVIDSRLVDKGTVFIATRGERVDGHAFIPEVFRKGALGAVCERLPENREGPCILVKDSFQALKEIAGYYRRQLPVKVVGITGSVGKTSTKEFVASVLARRYRVHKTQGNFNNEVGLPLTILRMPEDTQMAVLEMGINHFGEMRRLSEIARPDICVMTNIGQCHLESLGSREGILRAKSEIFEFMSKDGKVCLNGDDDMLSTIREVQGIEPIRFGCDSRFPVYATQIVEKGLLGSDAVLYVAGERIPVHIPLPGGHMVYNALAAAAVGWLAGLSKEEISEGISRVEAVGGRSHVIDANGKVLIDDCYNANPVSMRAAIDLLKQAQGRKVAILGDMFELGDEEEQMHAQVGSYAAKQGVDVILGAGALAGKLCEAAAEAGVGKVCHYQDREQLIRDLPKLLHKGDTILVKASHGMGFEKIVEELTQA